jgi:glucose/arabinose dehydrogenase
MRTATVIFVLASACLDVHAQPIDLRATEVASNLNLITDIVHAGDGSGRLYLADQSGLVFVLEDGVRREQPFLDIRQRTTAAGELGLLSIAFPPDYSERREMFAYYTDPLGATALLSRFEVAADGHTALLDSERVVMLVSQPFTNHNGGRIQFGPDGYLYLSTGDGGGAGDPERNGQNLGSLLGKILRIDAYGGATPYAIPPDNPFVGQAGRRAEIWSYGLRNPWRISFDSETGDLYIADVGQNQREEVNFQAAGASGGQNYGWDMFEGTLCFRQPCNAAGVTMPVFEYSNPFLGCSITGGEVYRGNHYPAMRGMYLFGDFCSGRIWGMSRSGGSFNAEVLLESGFSIATFGTDEAGNVYVADRNSRKLFLLSDGPPLQNLQPIVGGLSGAWFDPEQSGHGIFLEVLEDDEIFAAWFTFRPEGGQAWIVAQGPHQGDRAVLPAGIAEGAQFIPDFRSEDVVTEPWGTWTLTFEDCDNGLLEYESVAGFGSGSMRLTRLTRISGLPCGP